MFYIVDTKSGCVVKTYQKRGWAVREHERRLRDTPRLAESFEVMSVDDYLRRRDEIDPYVEVKNLMSGKPLLIRKSDVGTCVDPSTETYWSM